MATTNTITLVGNVTDDPELRFTPGGAAVANFTVAVNRRQPAQGGGWEDKLDGFFRCNCWREMAENVAESLQKGMRVMVVGRLQQRSWEDAEGNRRSVVEIQVDEIGPSLRWATATVTKSTRSSGPSGGGQEGARDAASRTGGGWQQPGGQRSGGDWGAPAPVGAEEGGF
jgi:single-strand DNA-binding protein